MAEFCLDCWNRINGTDDEEDKYILSEELDLCEGCGEWKHVVIAEHHFYYKWKFRNITRPLKIIGRIIILPYLIFKYVLFMKKAKKQDTQ